MAEAVCFILINNKKWEKPKKHASSPPSSESSIPRTNDCTRHHSPNLCFNSTVNDKSKDIKKGGKHDAKEKQEVSTLNSMKIRELEKTKVGMYFAHNTQLGPPY